MSIIEISQRIATLADAHRECMLLIVRLSKLGSPGTDAARIELANEIHQSLKDAEQELELLATQVDDEVSDGSANSAALNSKINKLTEDMKIARLQYRKAQLAAKRTSEAAAQRERDALLGSSGRSTPDSKRRGRQALSQTDLLVNASTDVTVALRRTHNLLQSELSRSRFATETLNASTAALTDLTHRYTAFDDIVASSRELIMDLVRKNKSDRWYYENAIRLLIGMLVWILVRRLVWGPVWLLVGVPFKLVWWTLTLAAWVMGVGGDGGVAEIRKGVDRIENVVGGTATVEVKGIPESMLERVPEVRRTGSMVVEEPMATEESVWEKVERIIDREEDVVIMEEEKEGDKDHGSRQLEDEVQTEQRNPKSSQLEDDRVEEQTVQTEERNPKSRQLENDPREEKTEERNPRSRQLEGDLVGEQVEARNPKSRRMEYDPVEEQVGARNPKSRRMEYDPVEEARVLEEPAAEVTVDSREAVEKVHDEL